MVVWCLVVWRWGGMEVHVVGGSAGLVRGVHKVVGR